MTAEAPTIVITGATNGLGALAAASLAATGAHLILVARSAQRARQTISSMSESNSVEAEVFVAASRDRTMRTGRGRRSDPGTNASTA